MTPEPASDDGSPHLSSLPTLPSLPSLLPLLALFDDLEQQAAGLELERRDLEVEDRLRDEYAEVDLAARLHASVGTSVDLELVGSEPVRGVLARVGADWCLLAVEGAGGGVGGGVGGVTEVLVRQSALVATRGLSERAVPSGARAVLSRLTLASCLRRLGEAGERQVVRTVDGRQRAGVITRVGADFVEVWDEQTSGAATAQVQVPLRALTWVRPG